jgi:hypothetical protein
MYETTSTIYLKIAELLLEKIGMRDFFSGSVSLNDGDVECRLTCTLVIERERRDPSEIVALLPVWWEFKTIVGTEELSNDFSWCEMLQTVEL